MSPSDRNPAFTCATCEIEIVDKPVFHTGLAFCCAGCAADGPCGCSYDETPAAALRGLGADVAAPTWRRHVLAVPAEEEPDEEPVHLDEEPALASVLG